jgi:hypothetical protein
MHFLDHEMAHSYCTKFWQMKQVSKIKRHVRDVYLAGQLAGVGPVLSMNPDRGAVSEH